MTILNIQSPNVQNVKNIYSIILDTNVLYYVFIGNNIAPSSIEKQYQSFILKCINKKVKLYTSSINISELFHLYENEKLKLYNAQNNTSLTLKEFHKIKTERTNIRQEFKVYYNNIKNTINVLDDISPINNIESFLDSGDDTVDLFDFSLVSCCEKHKINYIITNDSDFFINESGFNISISLYILTANTSLINKYTTQQT